MTEAAQWLPLDSLTPWQKNPRINAVAAVRLAASIKRFGFGAPIVARKDGLTIIAGHTRRKAILLLQAQWATASTEERDQWNRETVFIMTGGEVPVRVLDVSAHDAALMALADNKLGEFAQWDDEPLAEIVAGLNDAEGMDLAGFDDKELRRLVPTTGASDDAPDLPLDPVCKPGDLWRLGQHTLVCGDALQDSGRALGDHKPDILWSDPPYGLGGYAGRGGKLRPVAGDDATDGQLRKFYELGSAAEMYICCEYKTYGHLLAARGVPRSCVVWAKPHFGMGRGYRRQHEFIGYWGKLDSTTESDLWSMGRDTDYKHPTQKPVALVARALANSGKAGSVVLDPFCGSGPGVLAAHQLSMVCAAVELDPAYCDVIIERWQDFSGGVARRA